MAFATLLGQRWLQFLQQISTAPGAVVLTRHHTDIIEFHAYIHQPCVQSPVPREAYALAGPRTVQHLAKTTSSALQHINSSWPTFAITLHQTSTLKLLDAVGLLLDSLATLAEIWVMHVAAGHNQQTDARVLPVSCNSAVR